MSAEAIDVESAKAVHAALCAPTNFPRAVRYEFRRRAKEWAHAVALVEAAESGMADEGAVIVLAGSVVPGMEVPVSLGWGEVMRVIRRDAQVTLHVEHPEDPRPVYQNFYGPSSPCVVRA